jgi:hypothetical protein
MRIVIKHAMERTLQKSARPMKQVALQDKNQVLYDHLLKEIDKKI